MGTVLSFSPPRDRRMVYDEFAIQNFSYEQLNNVKNKEKLCYINNNNNNNNTSSENNLNLNQKNTLKKHSLFINALSWKRFTSGSTKKKQENKNKVIVGRQPLDAIHPFIDNNKNIQKSLMCYSDPNKLRLGQLDLVSGCQRNSLNNNNVVLLPKQLPPLPMPQTKNGSLPPAPPPPPPPPRQSSRSAPPTTVMKPAAPTSGKKTIIQASTSELLR